MPRQAKTIEYRRARWLVENLSLENLTRQAWLMFETQIERTVIQRDNSAISGLRANDLHASGFAIHCARYTDQQGIGTIPMIPTANADIGERVPEEDENFMNSDFMALVRGNHVIALNAGRNAAALRVFLAGLFHNAEFDEEALRFELARIGNLDKLAMIEAVGVKSLDLNVDISKAAAIELGEGLNPGGIWSNITRNIGEKFQSIIARDEEISQLGLAEKGRVTVSINVAKGDLQVAKRGLDHLAEAVAADDDADDFLITLRNKQTIKPSEVTVRKQVRLDAVANSVSVDQAWAEMRTFMNELIQNGQIEA